MLSKEEVKHIAKLARLGLGDEPKGSSLPTKRSEGEEENEVLFAVAKARVTEEEIGKYQKELSSILDYIEKLKEVDISKIEPTSHSIIELPKEAKIKKRIESSSPRVENVERNDESLKFKVQSSKLLDLAPETKQGFLKVKSIFK